MKNVKQISRITALLLTAAMILSTFSFYAETALAESLSGEDMTLYSAQDNEGQNNEGQNDGGQNDGGQNNGGQNDGGQNDGNGDDEEDPPVPAKPPEIKFGPVVRSGKDITLEWTGPKEFPKGLTVTACRIYTDGSDEGVEVPTDDLAAEKLSFTYTGSDYHTKYTFRAEYTYKDENGEEKTVSSDTITAMTEYEQPLKRALGSFTLNDPQRLLSNGSKFNLREYAAEPYNGYAVVQGSCVDNKGEYAYYCLINTNSDYGKIIKVRMSDNVCVAVSRVFYFAHGNGMCFDSRRNRVVVASYENYRKKLTFVDPDDLNNIEQKIVKYGSLRDSIYCVGITALAYNAKYDCYVTMQKTDHNVIIYDAETLTAKAIAYTAFDEGHTGIFQSIDADDTYVYFLLSENGSSQPYNLLVAFDWHAENYAALLNGTSNENTWMCGTEGEHSAVIRITGANEIESLYHTDAGNGQGHFYLTNYHNDPTYKITKKKVKWKKVKKKVKVKKKWKKVWKKVKWKKVKTKSGKTKWKYKKKKVWKYKYVYKTKKVWKYKTKKIKTYTHDNRDNFVMDLGVF